MFFQLAGFFIRGFVVVGGEEKSQAVFKMHLTAFRYAWVET
jgi:hypothetical protein